MKILHLVLKRQWFEMIDSGIKLAEYREIKPYWTNRLEGKNFTHVEFRGGYQAGAPRMRFEIKKIDIGMPMADWCGNQVDPFEPVYRIHLGARMVHTIQGKVWS